MPKKKRRPTAKQPGRTAGALNRLARERDQALREFAGWRSSMDPGLEAERAASSVRTLVELKAEHLDSPEIGRWSVPLIDELLTVVVPRRVAQRREDSMAMAGDLAEFFGFLERTGRWDLASPSVFSVQEHLRDIEFTVLEAADDPSRRSVSGNILHLAVEHGVPLEDREALEDFMAWYNRLPHAERVSVSDTGRLQDESYAYRPGAGRGTAASLRPPGSAGERSGSGIDVDDLDALDRLCDAEDAAAQGSSEHLPFWPWYLEDGMERQLDEVPSDEEFRRQVAAAARENTYVQRAFAVLDVIGPGSRVTATDALGRPDTQELLARFGLAQSQRSMWDVPEIADPYQSLIMLGAVEMQGRRIVPTEAMQEILAAPAEAELRDEFSVKLLVVRLIESLVRERSRPELLDAHDVAGAVLFAAQPEGLDVPVPHEITPLLRAMAARIERDPYDLFVQLVMVRLEFETLAQLGVLERDEETFHADAAVRLAVYAALEHVMDLRGQS
ncbi:hypothetical protein [Brachybacterium phenoliresistens]|uniref:Uncharacterized protein n=1 Tax=Brachybacterium phenoliresistens TaxID=396014 RepID=Z9JWC8_9MICO|nr:hypothetical protein [Brachybacterium phenoliresistens]EWS82494.1 hypothetical protein BF93_12635 [Brachybacterium phenoliresistens]